MNRIHTFMRWAWSFLVVFTLAFAMSGCEGDDGAAGPAGATGTAGADGATGPPGPPGAAAPVVPLESCAVCHDDGSYVSAMDAHALPQIEAFSNVAFSPSGDDLVVTFELTVDGAPGVGYDALERGYRQNGTDSAIVLSDFSALTDNGDGSYSFTITNGNLAVGNNRYLFRVSSGGERETRVYVWGDYPATAFAAPVVGANACGNCHGPEGIDIHGGYYTAADVAEPCLVCHGGPAPWSGQPVASLVDVTHGLHSGIWVEDPAEGPIEVTYPTYMTNCSVCHAEPAELAAANAMSVSGANCFTCHGSMDGFDFTASPFHLTIVDPETADCTACHSAGGAVPTLVDVTDFHDGWETPRHGFIYDGVDTSIVEGEKFDWSITSMADDGVNLTFTWQASYDGVGVDPCNETVGVGAPTFHLGPGSLRTYRSYSQGDDFIIGTSTSDPGQPSRANPDATNTTCSSGVATTVIPVEAVTAERARIALGGKPRVESPDVPGLIVEARVPSPTFDWEVGDGTQTMRRAIVDTEKCLDCHVGSLYQHGGDRVDNVDYCLVCHNSASNEQSVRVGMGVDADEAYDGQVGETYEMKTMIHRIHSAGEEGSPPYVIYRNRGIYGFATDDSLLPNWPGTGQQLVFGSDGVTTNHNFHSPTYPRSLYECTACHVAGFDDQPSAAEAMATTIDAGSVVWDDQVDDVLQGAVTTSCITCHADSASKGHAYQNSWVPQAFPEGRETIIEAND